MRQIRWCELCHEALTLRPFKSFWHFIKNLELKIEKQQI